MSNFIFGVPLSFHWGTGNFQTSRGIARLAVYEVISGSRSKIRLFIQCVKYFFGEIWGKHFHFLL